MDLPAGGTGAEELSFGGDPDRDPRLRAWVSAHRGLVAAGVAVLVLLGVLAGGGRYLYDQSRKALPPPAGPLPEQLGFTVTLCDSDLPRPCAEGVFEIADDPGRVEDALRAIPEVTSVRYISREDAYQMWRRSSSQFLEEKYRVGIRPEYFQNSFKGTLRRSADYPRFAERVRPLAGVRNVSRSPTTFWRDKADLAIYLCGDGYQKECGTPANRQMTEDQKQAIVDRIRSVDGVEKVYFEDRAHAVMLFKHYFPETKGPAEGDVVEAFHVKGRTTEVADLVRRAVKGMPGVLASEMYGAE